MKTAIYPGSFNPWHRGHSEIAHQASTIFDRVIVARCINPDKPVQLEAPHFITDKELMHGKIVQVTHAGLLLELVKKYDACAVIKGLRNAQDLEYERVQQYWNEDLGMKIPTLYLIASRNTTHISSSAIRALNSFKKG